MNTSLKPSLSLLALVLSAIVAVSQSPAPPAASNTGVIEGTIQTAGTTPEPIPGVQVQLTAQAARAAGIAPAVPILTATTDDKGHFTFNDLNPGQYQFRYQIAGYFPLQEGGVKANGTTINFPQRGAVQALRGAATAAAAGQFQVLTFALGALHVNFSISMNPGGIITGRIINSNGSPATNERVLALGIAYQDGQRVMYSSKTATTNDRGEYRLFGLDAGEYYVRSDYRVSGTARGSAAATSRVYYPGVDDPNRATRVAIKPGAESGGINFNVQAATTVNISGTIVNPIPGASPSPTATTLPATGRRGGGLPGAAAATVFYLLPRDDGAIRDDAPEVLRSYGTAADQSEGKFEIRDVRPGHYVLYAMVRNVENNATVRYTGHIAVDVGSQDLSGIRIVLRPDVDLRYRFTANGDPIAQTQLPPVLALRGRDSLPSQLAQPLVQPAGFQLDWRASSVMAEGQYVLDSTLSTLQDVFVADIREGDKSIYETGTIVAGSDIPETVEIVLSRGAGMISGSVLTTSATPASGVQVILIPNGSRRKNPLLYKRATSGADGQFALVGLAPGAYKLFAWETIPIGAEMNAEFMKDYDERGIPVTIEPGTQLMVEIPVLR
jgi:hypothetical protein